MKQIDIKQQINSIIAQLLEINGYLYEKEEQTIINVNKFYEMQKKLKKQTNSADSERK